MNTANDVGFALIALDLNGSRVAWLGPGLGMGRGRPHIHATEQEARNAMIAIQSNAPGEYRDFRIEPIR